MCFVVFKGFRFGFLGCLFGLVDWLVFGVWFGFLFGLFFFCVDLSLVGCGCSGSVWGGWFSAQEEDSTNQKHQAKP